jgi:hypothetical protein
MCLGKPFDIKTASEYEEEERQADLAAKAMADELERDYPPGTCFGYMGIAFFVCDVIYDSSAKNGIPHSWCYLSADYVCNGMPANMQIDSVKMRRCIEKAPGFSKKK